MNSRHPDPRRMWKVGPAPTTSVCKLRANYGRITEVLRMGFAVVVAAVVVEPRRFGRGNWCLHFPKALVRNESRRTASPKKELDEGRGSKNSQKKKVLRREVSIVENLSGLQESIFSLSRGP